MAATALNKKKPMSPEKADAAAKDFESMFIAQMLGNMFGDATVGLFGDEETHEIYKTMMVDAYGKEISHMGGIGIASYVKRELLTLQEVKS